MMCGSVILDTSTMKAYIYEFTVTDVYGLLWFYMDLNTFLPEEGQVAALCSSAVVTHMLIFAI